MVSADVNCTAGSAVCKVKPGTELDDLVQAIDDAGFKSRAAN